MSTPLSLLARLARMQGLRDALDLGGAKVLFYTGNKAAEPGSATTETLLGTIALATPCGALGQSNSLATLTFDLPKITLAAASGAIGWLRFVDGAGHGFLDLDAGLVGSGAPALVNVTQVFMGGEIQLISCILAE